MGAHVQSWRGTARNKKATHRLVFGCLACYRSLEEEFVEPKDVCCVGLGFEHVHSGTPSTGICRRMMGGLR